MKRPASFPARLTGPRNGWRREGTPVLTVLAALAVLGILAACSAPLNRPAPERRYYNITAVRPEAATPASDKSALKVRPLQISPAYQGKEMVYRLGETEFESDYYNTFFVQPANNLSQQAEQWLGRAGIFGHVVDSTSQVADTHLLEGLVNALYGDFRDKANPKAVLEMQFFLLRNKNDTYSVAFSKSYRKEVPFQAGFKDASGLAAAYNTALAEILGELEKDLRGAR
ncbi:ABC-type transport auxiliary lipoprotein family protein [Fundidesulfovibrio terrae]|uniref:ABC-type transport auxiliary lipoprotein family protein n=1 Tax=Fundidesulfovibrio terrae TaxID=2922866 RepID=UPI001FB02B0D|nr:ABC-type transport auxiliary lipoprotein family protein [Fundidesulfovibrio terrae]